MKVVLFCGGLGLRMREASERVPKPMVPIGGRPILWHVMKYFAHFGHTRFVICLGYKGEVIKEFFLTYNEALSNDFVLTEGGRTVELLRPRHPGLGDHVRRHRPAHVSIGERLRAVQPHLEGEDVFLANYGDVLTDAPISRRWSRTTARSGAVASFLCVKPGYTFHLVQTDDDDYVRSVVGHDPAPTSGSTAATSSSGTRSSTTSNRARISSRSPSRGSARPRQLLANKYEGFWAPMDTLKDQQRLEQMLEPGTGRGRSGSRSRGTRRRRRSSRPSPPERSARRDAMLELLSETNAPIARILCLGAHCDDIEIGCGGTVLKLLEARPDVHVDWIVFSSDDEAGGRGARRRGRAPRRRGRVERRPRRLPAALLPVRRRGDQGVLRRARRLDRAGRGLHALRPTTSTRTTACSPSSTYNTWRDHLVLEYEIPKWDGDLGRPNVYVRLEQAHVERKVETIWDAFASQRDKHWFTKETFLALMRPARRRVQGAERVRGGLPLPEARARMTAGVRRRGASASRPGHDRRGPRRRVRADSPASAC